MANIESKTNFNRGEFLVFLSVFALLAWQVTRPLMTSIIWAGMLAFMVSPIFGFLNRKSGGRWPGLSTLLTLAVLLLLFILPVIAIMISIGNETASIYSTIKTFVGSIEPGHLNNPAALIPSWTPAWADKYLREFLNNSQMTKAVLNQLSSLAADLIKRISTTIIQGASAFIFHAFVTLMTAFFFIRDGDSILAYIKSVTPLTPSEKKMFFYRCSSLLYSVIYGDLLTVAIQAVLGGLGWWFVGLGNPTFFGMLMFIFGLFPAGTIIVWLPGAIYLLATGETRGGIILFIWGAGIVSTIDNLLRPFLISGGNSGKGENVNSLLIFLGIFGGIIQWGFLGIFLGPLVLVLFMLVFDIYRIRWFRKPQD